jgi:hypothetical protein
MKRIACTAVALVLGALGLAAQGKGNATRHSPARTQESNAPARTPNGTTDRDFGRDRAEEVGKGKKTGVDKQDKVRTSRAKGKKSR